MEANKTIKDVIIEYEDGTQEKLPYFALVGFNEELWHQVLQSPDKRDAKIKMNNYLVDLSNKLIESIGM